VVAIGTFAEIKGYELKTAFSVEVRIELNIFTSCEISTSYY
jgi:hypothetical protein